MLCHIQKVADRDLCYNHHYTCVGDEKEHFWLSSSCQVLKLTPCPLCAVFIQMLRE